jgi:hypothetical protein
MQDTQTMIVRQSSLKFVNDYTSNLDQPIGIYETVALAEIIKEYVLNGRTADINKRLMAFDKFVMKESAKDIVDKIKFELRE